MQRMDQTVGARLPLLGEHRLELEGGFVDPQQARLHQQCKKLGRLGAGDDAIERPRLAPYRNNQLAASLRLSTARGIPGAATRSDQLNQGKNADERKGNP